MYFVYNQDFFRRILLKTVERTEQKEDESIGLDGELRHMEQYLIMVCEIKQITN